jgi:tripartite-type tricarboxylate transporter receptor subunit TctC
VKPIRLRCTAFLAALACAIVAIPGFAQPYPVQPIKIIVPQGPGGGNDTVARIYAQKLSEVLGKPVIVENRAGAGGAIGTTAVAKAAPDGYTLLLTLTSSHTVAPALYKKVTFDPIKDFEPVALLATSAYLLVANPEFPATTVKELIAQARKQPGSISFASAGNGTLNHLLGEMLKTSAGIDMVHVPYKSASAAVTDVVGGRVPVSFQSVPSAITFVKAGKLKVLAVSTEQRIAILPQVPTVGESVPGFGATPWYGLLAPAGTPKDVIEKLYAASQQALADKEVQQKLAANGADVALQVSRAQFGDLIRSDLQKWDVVVKKSGATVD